MRPRPPPPDAAQVLAAAARAAAHLRLPPGISPVLMPPPPDRCSVCDLAVEWDDDQLVQCDACSLLVHMRCYGIRDLPDGSAWSCAACSLRLAAPPPCALCPVVGGAMKRTTCGRWCHVACAQWIPETSFVDSDLVEPVDGIGKVGKARLALKCGLCRQGYGACIQCAGGRHCYATYHPLCARGRGYVMEVREAAGGGGAAKAASGGASRKRPAAGALDDKAVTGLGDGLFVASFCPKCAPRAAAAAAGGAGGGGSAPARATPVKGAKASKKAQAAAQRPPRPRQPRPQLFSAQQALPDLSACGVPGCARTVPLDWSLRRLRREPAAISASWPNAPLWRPRLTWSPGGDTCWRWLRAPPRCRGLCRPHLRLCPTWRRPRPPWPMTRLALTRRRPCPHWRHLLRSATRRCAPLCARDSPAASPASTGGAASPKQRTRQTRW